MLSVQMPFCSEVIDFFTCPVTLDEQAATADSFASREYFSNLRALPDKGECHVSFKAFTCYRCVALGAELLSILRVSLHRELNLPPSW